MYCESWNIYCAFHESTALSLEMPVQVCKQSNLHCWCGKPLLGVTAYNSPILGIISRVTDPYALFFFWHRATQEWELSMACHTKLDAMTTA